MINKNFFFFKILIKYNVVKNIRLSNFIRYNYQFYTKPISTFLKFFFFLLIDSGCINTDDKFVYNHSINLNPTTLNFIDKNSTLFIF
jgi:hypothetical protein